MLAESPTSPQCRQGKFPRRWPQAFGEARYSSICHLGKGSWVWLPALPCPSLPTALCPLTPQPYLCLAGIWGKGQLCLQEGASGQPPVEPTPVVCGWDGEELQGSREPRSKNSVPRVLWHLGLGIRLRSVSWAWSKVFLSLSHLIHTNTRCTTV